MSVSSIGLLDGSSLLVVFLRGSAKGYEKRPEVDLGGGSKSVGVLLYPSSLSTDVLLLSR